MTKQINKRDDAKRAIIDIADQLAQGSSLASTRFMDSVERSLAFLASMPEIGEKGESPHPRLKDMRVWQVEGFPNYLLFYRPNAQGVDLIFVCHSARDVNRLLENL